MGLASLCWEVRGQPGEAAREQGPPHPALAAPGQGHRSTWAALAGPRERHRQMEINPKPSQAHSPAGAGIMRCLQTPGAMPTQRLPCYRSSVQPLAGGSALPSPQAPSAPSAKSQRSPLSRLLQEQCAALCGSNAPQRPADSGLLRRAPRSGAPCFLSHHIPSPSTSPPRPQPFINLPCLCGGQPLQHLPTERTES